MKGQSSIEFLIILAFSLIAFAGIVFFTNSRIGSINFTAGQELARQDVELIAEAASDAFIQGEGSSSFFSIIVPEGISAENSGIRENSIIYNFANGASFFKSLAFPLQGSLPLKQGYYGIRVFSKDGIVFVRPSCILPDKAMVFEKLRQASGFQEQLLLKNTSSETVSVSLAGSLNSEDVSLSFSRQDFDLNSAGSEIIVALLSAKPTASGNYSGKLSVSAISENCTDSFEIPISLQVSGTGVLSVFPAKISGNFRQGSFHSVQLSICNNSQQVLENVVSGKSEGIPGEWFSETAPVQDFTPGCVERTVEFAIPSNAFAGNYSGFLTFSDLLNLASIDLNITVEAG